MSSANRMIILMLVVVALGAAFWVLLLGPKRQQADDLSGEVDQARASLAESQSQAAEAAAARRGFPSDYQQLVVLGKAVPQSDDTSSLLVELNSISGRSKVRFDGITISDATSAPTTSNLAPTPAPSAPAPSTPPSGETAEGDSTAVPASATVAPTETAAALLPIGARNGDPYLGFPPLDATFAVTTSVTPAAQGLTAGASPTGPAAAGTTTPASTPPSPTTPSGAAATATTAASTEAAR